MNRIDGGHDMVSYDRSDDERFQALSDPNVVKPTLDWAVRQAYSLVKRRLRQSRLGRRRHAPQGRRCGVTSTAMSKRSKPSGRMV